MNIERHREKSLRRQFEYIVYNVKVSFISFFIQINKDFILKELERRRQLRRRTKLPDYYERISSPTRHRSYVRHSV